MERLMSEINLVEEKQKNRHHALMDIINHRLHHMHEKLEKQENNFKDIKSDVSRNTNKILSIIKEQKEFQTDVDNKIEDKLGKADIITDDMIKEMFDNKLRNKNILINK